MPNPYHFAINADDVPRARRFYERVFGWTFSAWGPPKFYMIQTNAAGEEPGLRGSLQGRRELVAGQKMTGFEITIAVPSIDDTAAAVLGAGGKVVMQKSIITGVGALMFFEDTEGNVFGAIQPDAQAE
ncbi:MAG TPA: VOC family protein [Thermoanaerobaculia bacterium]|nr:VOC family protein [Thermoanaerobaculia bacterium]